MENVIDVLAYGHDEVATTLKTFEELNDILHLLATGSVLEVGQELNLLGAMHFLRRLHSCLEFIQIRDRDVRGSRERTR
jgi:hypothetical protein